MDAPKLKKIAQDMATSSDRWTIIENGPMRSYHDAGMIGSAILRLLADLEELEHANEGCCVFLKSAWKQQIQMQRMLDSLHMRGVMMTIDNFSLTVIEELILRSGWPEVEISGNTVYGYDRRRGYAVYVVCLSRAASSMVLGTLQGPKITPFEHYEAPGLPPIPHPVTVEYNAMLKRFTKREA